MSESQILTAEQMRAAEQRIFASGTTEFELMQVAAAGAAEWIRRVSAGRRVTILCGPGNNGGDGYVIGHILRQAGNSVTVVAPESPKTSTALKAKALWGGEVLTAGGGFKGDVFVDCLFGSGLSRPLSGEHALLLRDLADRHHLNVALDVPSGISSDTGAQLNERVPSFDLTLSLGAWKFAHWMLPGRAKMGTRRLVPIGIDPVDDAVQAVQKPTINPPEQTSHKYTRGLAAIIGGDMPGASLLSAQAAMRSGAGYVKLLAAIDPTAHFPDLVVDRDPLETALGDARIAASLIGPGLGRGKEAVRRLQSVLAAGKPTVLDADALVGLKPEMLEEDATILATPHDGELNSLCRTFAVIADSRQSRALALARASGMVVCAKGPDTFIAAPDGRMAIAPSAPSWLSVAGSGDVLAGIAVSRMATGLAPFEAACEAVWLHGEAARHCGPAFTPSHLADAVAPALARCL